MPNVYDYLSVKEVEQVKKMHPNPIVAGMYIAGIVRARGGNDTKLQDELLAGMGLERDTSKEHLYKTDYKFL